MLPRNDVLDVVYRFAVLLPQLAVLARFIRATAH
jgi:hypothetical protein